MLQNDKAQRNENLRRRGGQKDMSGSRGRRCGPVDMARESIEKERNGMLYVYPLTRSIISVIVVNNRGEHSEPGPLCGQ